MESEVRLGRWQDVLPGTYDPARAVVITDPPYGLDVYGGAALRPPGANSSGRRPGPQKGYADTVPWATHVAEVLSLLPAARHVIRGPATMIVRRGHPQPRRLAIEMAAYRRRDAHRPGVIPYLWQGWCIYGRLKIDTPRREMPAGDATIIRPYADRTLRPAGHDQHRAITPYAAALWIVGDWAERGDGWTVLDPFAGTGTIGRAAGAYGIAYLGAEIDPRWHAEASVSISYAQPPIGL